MTEQKHEPSQSSSTPVSPRSPRTDTQPDGTAGRTGRKRSSSFYLKTNPYNPNHTTTTSTPPFQSSQSQPQRQSESSQNANNVSTPPEASLLNLKICNRVRYRSLTREELESILPKSTLKQCISIELSKIGPLQIPEKIQVEEAKEFEEKAEKYIGNQSDVKLPDLRATDEGEELFRRALIYFKYFENKEQRKEHVDQGEFHLKSCVDHVLVQLMVDKEAVLKLAS
jgi:hypothetical protein